MKELASQHSPSKRVRTGAQRLLLVGNPEEVHVGAHLRRAAEELGYRMHFCDIREAWAGAAWWRKVNWHLRSHRPARLDLFSRSLEAACEQFRPDCLLSTGLAPVDADALQRIGSINVRRMNFLTDDPWNPAHHAPWFLRTVPLYDCIFSPRRVNLNDLRRAGCPDVRYMPFAYEPAIHFPEAPAANERPEPASDLLFAGGADLDRLPWMHALIDAGVRPALYGGYWDRDSKTAPFARGICGADVIRKAVAAAAICLCLVRRANRDGHAMRTFELAAMQACILAEDTEEHREILGPEGEAAIFFRSSGEMIEKSRWLLDHPADRIRLAASARTRIVAGRNTYADRLAAMVEPS